MFTLDNPRPWSGPLAKSVSAQKPNFGSNSVAFEAIGEKWASPYTPDAESPILSTPVVMREYMNAEDCKRFLEQDIWERRLKAQRVMAVKSLIKSGLRIPKN